MDTFEVSSWTARVREALHEGPSAESWSALTHALDRAPDAKARAALMPMLERTLASWPEGLRWAPLHWWREAARGTPPSGWSLVRALRGAAEPKLAESIASAPASRQLRHLDLEGCELSNAGLTALCSSVRLRALRSTNLTRNGIDAPGWLALSKSRALENLESLELSENAVSPRALVSLLSCEGLSKLQQLRARACGLGPEGARLAAARHGVRKLWSLDLSDNELGPAGAGALAACDHLNALSALALDRNHLADLSAVAISRSGALSALNSLSLRENQLGPEGARALGRCAVDELDLSDNPLTDEGVQSILQSPASETLSVLRLAGCALTGRWSAGGLPLRILELSRNRLTHIGSFLGALPQLDTLLMKECELDEGALFSLSSARAPRLTRLSLSGTALTARPLAALCSASVTSNLEALDLEAALEGPDSLEPLLRSAWPQLRSLELSGSPLNDEGSERIGGSKALQNLRTLGLANAGISTLGLQAIFRSKGLRSLQRLNLEGNSLDDEAVEVLLSSRVLSQLHEVRIGDNPISPAALASLQANAPRLCQIRLKTGAR